MRYQRAVNRRVDDDARPATPEDEELALVARCWPQLDDEPLPRVVQRGGQAVLDEAWILVEEGSEDTEETRL